MIETSSGLHRKSPGIFGNFRKMFGNIRLAFGTILKNLWKSSENHQNRRHQYVYIILVVIKDYESAFDALTLIQIP